MLKVKDTLRATVHLGFDGRVFKAYHGPDAKTRFENEVRVLRHLEARGCPFVPRLLEADPAQLKIVTTTAAAAWNGWTKNACRNYSRNWSRLACATMIRICAMSPTGFPTGAFV